MKDYAVECASSEHQTARAFAATLVVFFAIGLPVLYLILLVRANSKDKPGSSSLIGFISEDYQPRYFFWEVLECGRKLLLTGFSVFFGAGSITQAVLGMLITLVHLLAIAWLRPYAGEDASNNQAAIVDYFALFLVLLQVVMCKYLIVVEVRCASSVLAFLLCV